MNNKKRANGSSTKRKLSSSIAMIIAGQMTLGASGYVQAQEKLALEEIVVTAQRKAESLQEVPISVTAMGGEQLANAGIAFSTDLPAVVPGLTYATTGPAATPYLRGVGSNAGNPSDEPSVATYIDGVYIGSNSAVLQSLAGLERVEVLKGPQGTLFGRNATAGVIQYITKDPSFDPIVEVSLGVANYRTTEASIYASAGITETIAADVTISGTRQDEGWGKQVDTGQDVHEEKNSSIRTKLLYQGEDLDAVFSADASEYETNMMAYTQPAGTIGFDGLPAPSNIYDTRGYNSIGDGGPARAIIRASGASLRLDYAMGEMNLVSITAYRDASSNYQPEADATPAPAVEGYLPTSTETFSQELQLQGENDWLDWTTGLYLYNSDAAYDLVDFYGWAFGGYAVPASFIMSSSQETDSESVFFQTTSAITDQLDFTVGGRHTHERQSFNSSIFGTPLPSPNDKGYDKNTWRLGLNYNVNDDIMVYLSKNKGIKGGGFDLLTPGTGGGFDPESVIAWELGIKSQLLDNTLRLNAALFHYDFSDIQVQVIPAGGAGIAVTTNAAGATIKGLDVDFEYVVTSDFTLSGGFAFIDGKYDNFENTIAYGQDSFFQLVGGVPTPVGTPPTPVDASGNETIRTPRFSGNVTGEYRIDTEMGSFPISVTVSHNGGYYFDTVERMEQEAYTLLNATFGWKSPDEQYSLTLWGRNLTDEEYLAQGVPTGHGDMISPAAPRTYGLTFKASIF